MDDELAFTLAQRDRVEQFLLDRGADRIPHPGGTLLAHLIRVADVLTAWSADSDICAAGLCHAMYGTDGFNRSLLELHDRPRVAELIGARAEALVYLYGSCDRGAVYPHLDAASVVFRDRFSGNEFRPTDAAFRAFLEITAANELDVMAHNAELAAQYGAALYQLFERCKDRLSPKALHACRALLAPD